MRGDLPKVTRHRDAIVTNSQNLFWQFLGYLEADFETQSGACFGVAFARV